MQKNVALLLNPYSAPDIKDLTCKVLAFRAHVGMASRTLLVIETPNQIVIVNKSNFKAYTLNNTVGQYNFRLTLFTEGNIGWLVFVCKHHIHYTVF
jgi:hypothetical protein